MGERWALPLHRAAHGPPPRAELGEDFGGCAARLAGMAGVVFGWTPGVFWDATPAELAALVVALTGDEVAAADRGTLMRLMEAFPDG